MYLATLAIYFGAIALADVNTLPNGVAAGDVDQTSAILWTHTTTLGEVRFEYSTSQDFSNANIVTTSASNSAIPVKVEITGFNPNTQYYYRVTNATGAASAGQFRTLAEVGGLHGLRFGVSGDWRGELRPYPVIANIPARDLVFFLSAGDSIYADVPSVDFPFPQARSLLEFRVKHNEVYSERFGQNSWAPVRASTAIYAIFDDHEVTNDFAGGAPPSTDTRFDNTGAYINETRLFNNGVEVFHEYNPIRAERYGDTGDPRTAHKRKLYRSRTFGSDAALIILDARSFRDKELPEVFDPVDFSAIDAFNRASYDPSRTMLGQVQLDSLLNDLANAQAAGITWKFVFVPEPIQNLGSLYAGDHFEGYAFERSRILGFIDDEKIDNVVFISADIHGTIVNDLSYKRTFEEPPRSVASFEITTGPVAYAAPFGPTIVDLAPSSLRFLFGNYDHQSRSQQDMTMNRLQNYLLSLSGYPLVGLDGSKLDVRLCRGSYMVVNNFGWTEFDIDAATQGLLVTTWGIDWYDRATLEANPQAVLNRTPTIVSQFLVHPQVANDMLLPDRVVAPSTTAHTQTSERAAMVSTSSTMSDAEILTCPSPRPSTCGVMGFLPSVSALCASLFGCTRGRRLFARRC
ncbi:MAG: alkaline phosphatase D family protein [Planctomycetes bacterium]|nr:alkaline phosphatase D family protein [Planctomycetota bacterium]